MPPVLFSRAHLRPSICNAGGAGQKRIQVSLFALSVGDKGTLAVALLAVACGLGVYVLEPPFRRSSPDAAGRRGAGRQRKYKKLPS
jgi:hypothetical protein